MDSPFAFDDELQPHSFDPDEPYDWEHTGFSSDTLSLPDRPSTFFMPEPELFGGRSDSLPAPDPPSLFTSPPPKRNSGGADFNGACSDRGIVFMPRDLGFIPVPWPDRVQTFGDLVSDFFTRKSSANSRFLHKLVNALKISDENPAYFDLVGVAWIADTVFKVDKVRFARLLGIRAIDGSLFHKQGNFPSHGFVEICGAEGRAMFTAAELEGVDFDVVRLLKHEAGLFYRGNTPDVDEKCRWNGVKKAGAAAQFGQLEV
jgi:hypothetical protein